MDPAARADPGVDRALRLTIPLDQAETAGAILMDLLGAFEEQTQGDVTVLVFYPPAGETPSLEDVLAVLPAEARASGRVRLETRDVSREWVDGWKDHFRPTAIGNVRVRPPWEPALEGAATPGAGAAPLVDVVINPGLGFGTGLHPTTRGTLRLLQGSPTARGSSGASVGMPAGPSRGPLVDAGTGSGILAIAAAKLGWAPVFAFDNDPVALISAIENIEANGVQGIVEIHESGLDGAPLEWFEGATVLANMTLGPVLALLGRLATEPGPSGTAGVPASRPVRVVISGILAGAQERELLDAAGEYGLACIERIYETEWVSMELVPVPGRGMPRDLPEGY